MTATLEPDFGRQWEYQYRHPGGEVVATRRCADNNEALDYGTQFVLPEHGGPLIVARVDPAGVTMWVAELP